MKGDQQIRRMAFAPSILIDLGNNSYMPLDSIDAKQEAPLISFETLTELMLIPLEAQADYVKSKGAYGI